MTQTIKPFKNKGECLSLEPDDLQAVCGIAIDSLKTHRGQAKYENSAEGLQRFMDDAIRYFEMLRDGNADRDADKQMFPSIETLALFMGVTRKTIAQYAKRSEAWEQAIDAVRSAIAACKAELAAHYRIPPMVHLFDMVNNYQYHNTSEFRLIADTVGTDRVPALSVDELEQIASQDEPPQLPKGD